MSNTMLAMLYIVTTIGTLGRIFYKFLPDIYLKPATSRVEWATTSASLLIYGVAFVLYGSYGNVVGSLMGTAILCGIPAVTAIFGGGFGMYFRFYRQGYRLVRRS